MTPTMAEIRERLGACCFDQRLEMADRCAAVAVIIRDVEEGPEILLIKRAEREGDPWSGQIAFPGGHVDPVDATARQAAERETWEEIGLDLSRHGRFLGGLEPEQPLIRVRGRNVIVVPFAYELASEPDDYALNEEVAEIHWVSVGPLLRHENVSRINWDVNGETHSLPGFDVHGTVLWGMTFRILNRLFTVVQPGFQPLD